MQARVLTLRYSAALSGFDDSELQRLAAAHDLLELREHVVSVAGEPCVVLLATWARTEAGTASPPPEQVTEKALSPPAPSRNGARKPVADLLAGLDEAQRALFERIRAWRAKPVGRGRLDPNRPATWPAAVPAERAAESDAHAFVLRVLCNPRSLDTGGIERHPIYCRS